jgi:hypothetical protein
LARSRVALATIPLPGTVGQHDTQAVAVGLLPDRAAILSVAAAARAPQAAAMACRNQCR